MEQTSKEEENSTDVADKQLVPVSSPFQMASSLPTDSDEETEKQLFIKSKAVVKYGLYNYPLQFAQLHSNTNLNKAPSNWLRSTSPMEQYIRQMSQPKQKSLYASFQMGNSHLDQVGQMDVISDSENIKNLMKLPYNKSQPISMMVHRIGKTLFLDEFDVQKNLLRQQQEDWKWLKKFYHETIMRNQAENGPKPVRGRNVLQDRNMFSKFLYYSVESQSQSGKEVQAEPPELEESDSAQSADESPPPKTPGSGEFARTVEWTFEDIRMLIGTDLPIFGGGTHPCVSLRLRDMRQPINVLTGLDYWLDNLMCNVPELAMCYHLDGIVQNYELVTTNDIPSMQDDSQFSPSVIRDVAQNILSFLKTNVTKEGHTYWLFKGQNDDVIKLYDLTTLCSEHWDADAKNPFTIPVGMLLFRVARNIMNVYGRQKSGTVRTLLKNCLTLLDPTTHAQEVATACLMLADLYVKDDVTDQALPEQQEEGEWEEDKEENEVEEEECPLRLKHPVEISVPITSLCLSEEKPSGYLDVVGYAPMSAEVEERCNEALNIILQGLTCLDKSLDNEAESPTLCPDDPIPLGYEKLRPNQSNMNNTKTDDSSSCDDCTKNRETILPVSPRRRGLKSWQSKYRLSLLQKAMYAYYWLGDVRAKACKFGRALKCLRNALICYHAVGRLVVEKTTENPVLSSVLTLCGDVHMMLARETASQVHEDLYEMSTDTDKVILSHAEDAATRDFVSSISDIALMSRDSAVHLTRASAAYSHVVELLDSSDVTMRRGDVRATGSDVRTAASDVSAAVRRYGSAHNELGVLKMNQLATIYSENTDESVNLLKQHEPAWTSSLDHFHTAIQAFDRIADHTNMGLVHSNKARLMRVLAQGAVLHTNHERGEFTELEKSYFLKAIDSYRSALSILGSRNGCQGIWDSVRWELSSSYFNLATLLQDYAPLSTYTQAEIEKEVTAYTDKSLKFCDSDVETSRLPTCQYRAATIHHRLASLYHNSFRNQSLDQKKKHLRQLAELHYEKACRYFLLLESACEMLRVTLERVAMCEFHLQGQTSPSNKLRTLRQSLQYLLSCRAPLTLISNQAAEANSGFEAYVEEAMKLGAIFVSRLQFTLLSMVKLAKTGKKSKSNETTQMSLKRMYARSLQNVHVENENSSSSVDNAHKTALKLLEMVNDVESEWSQIEGLVCGQES